MVNVVGPYINLLCFLAVNHLRPRYPCVDGNWHGGCILSVKTFTRWEALSMTINKIALAASAAILFVAAPAHATGGGWWGHKHYPGCSHGGSRTSRSEEHTSELQSLMRISYAVFCVNKKTTQK